MNHPRIVVFSNGGCNPRESRCAASHKVTSIRSYIKMPHSIPVLSHSVCYALSMVTSDNSSFLSAISSPFP